MEEQGRRVRWHEGSLGSGLYVWEDSKGSGGKGRAQALMGCHRVYTFKWSVDEGH